MLYNQRVILHNNYYTIINYSVHLYMCMFLHVHVHVHVPTNVYTCTNLLGTRHANPTLAGLIPVHFH